MRIWGGLPTTGPAAPPSSPGRHRRAHPARRAQITPPFPPGRAGRMRHRLPAGERAGPPRRALAGLPQQARAGSRGALRADAGDLAGQLARAAPGEHIAFAIGARPIAPLGRLPDGAAGDGWRQRPARRRPGRRAGLPARLVPGGCVAAVPPGPGGPVDGPVR